MRILSVVVAIAAVLAIAAGPAHARRKPLWGRSTYYASRYVGQTMACGGRYRHRKMVAAVDLNLGIRCGKKLRVRNRANGRTVTVTVKDRCSCPGRTVVDLSRRAARSLGYITAGWARVRVRILAS